MAGRRTTAKAMKDNPSGAVLDRTLALIPGSWLLHLLAMTVGHAEQCSECAVHTAALWADAEMHAQAVEQIKSTFPKRASRKSAAKASAPARSRSRK